MCTFEQLGPEHFLQNSHELGSLVVILLVWLATAGTDDAQMLKNCQPCLQSDHDGSDYLADDEMSACSSPSHSELSDTEHEGNSQDTVGMFGIYGWLALCITLYPTIFPLIIVIDKSLVSASWNSVWLLNFVFENFKGEVFNTFFQKYWS